MRCIHCHQDLPITSFNKDKRTKNGLRTNCRECQSSFAKNYNKSHKVDLTQPHKRFNSAKSNAHKRNINWSLSLEEYTDLKSNPCFYCKTNIKTVGVGLDRLENNKGYELTNVVPCCAACNLGRNQYFTSEEWKIMIEALLNYRLNK